MSHLQRAAVSAAIMQLFLTFSHVQWVQGQGVATYQPHRHGAQQAGLDPSKEQRCALCLFVKPLDKFHKNAKRKTGRAQCCRDCDQTRLRGHKLGCADSAHTLCTYRSMSS